MRILLDEHLSYRVSAGFPEHQCETVGHRGWLGLKNGALLDVAEAEGFDVLLTLDDMRRERALEGRHISILLARSKSQGTEAILGMAGRIGAALERIAPGEIVVVD